MSRPCINCPELDHAHGIAADANRRVDAAWARLRAVYLSAAEAGCDVSELNVLRDHFDQGLATAEHDRRQMLAFKDFYDGVCFIMHMIERQRDGKGLPPDEAWEAWTSWLRKKQSKGHPCSGISMQDCRDSVKAQLAKVATDCPPPDSPLDPYGTPPLLDIEWSEQQMRGGRR